MTKNKLSCSLKNLKQKLKKTALMLTAVSSLSLATCKPEFFKPDIPIIPNAILNVTPQNITTGESSRIQLYGNEDIIGYEVLIDYVHPGTTDETIHDTYPIDLNKIFTQSANIYGKVVNSGGMVGEDGPIFLKVSSTIDLSEVDTDLNEETSKTLVLPSKDKGGNDVSYLSVIPFNPSQFNKINLNSNHLTLKGEKDEKGIYKINLEFESFGEKYYEILEGRIHNLIDFSGRMESNEEDGTGKQSVIRVFDTSKNSLEEIVTNDGNFGFRLNEKVSTAILQARLGSSGAWNSYVRTYTFVDDTGKNIKELDGEKDYHNLTIRAVPYSGLAENGISIEDFKSHLKETNVSEDTFIKGLKKWNFGEYPEITDKFEGIQILHENINGSSYGSFTSSEQEWIKNKILNPNDINSFVGGRILNSHVQIITSSTPDSEKRYNLISASPYVGWIIVEPNITINGGGETFIYDRLPWGYIDGVLIKIKTKNSESIITHEFGHALAFPYHATTLPPEKTIMRGDIIGYFDNPSFADKKAAKVIYEETYMPRESLENIMGLKWFDE